MAAEDPNFLVMVGDMLVISDLRALLRLERNKKGAMI
jgi:NDP-sugar pyrophosphorylase family protein